MYLKLPVGSLEAQWSIFPRELASEALPAHLYKPI